MLKMILRLLLGLSGAWESYLNDKSGIRAMDDGTSGPPPKP